MFNKIWILVISFDLISCSSALVTETNDPKKQLYQSYELLR